MKARGKRIDTSEWIEGFYFIEHFEDNGDWFPHHFIIHKNQSFEVHPTTIEYEVNNDWYSAKELSQIVGTMAEIGSFDHSMLEQENVVLRDENAKLKKGLYELLQGVGTVLASSKNI